ncbi:MAG: enoyl-CoA hydratase-related protein [Bdellovibrionota bacterium]
MTFQNLVYERDQQGIVTIRFNKPDQRNAMTEDMGKELSEAADRVAADPDARAVILTGEGSAFSAGGDMKMINENTTLPASQVRPKMRAFYSRFLKIRDIPVPTIAQINGPAIGAGLCVALACDLRLAAEDAPLSCNFTMLGLHPGMGATWLLTRVVGGPRAAELLYGSVRINGKEAERMGLVNYAVPAGELAKKTRAIAEGIAACGPVAVRLTKRALGRSFENTLPQQLDLEAEQQAHTFTTQDVREGLAAAAGKRPAKFEGR